MADVNVHDVSFEGPNDDDPPGFRSRWARLGPSLGAAKMGATVYELPPGEAICPYHYEYAEEEWLLVLEGTPTLRVPDGSSQLSPWDVCVFPAGPSGAHKVTNETSETVRVMMFSDVKMIAATVYPDSDKIGVWVGNEADTAMFRRREAVEYYTDEPGL